MTNADPVIQRAALLVRPEPLEFGYSDVGDVLVRYLRGDVAQAEALEELDNLGQDYARARGFTV